MPKRRFSLSADVIKHIFEGEISDNNFAGLHSEAVKSIENGGIKIHNGWPAGQLDRRTGGKSYCANIEVKIDGKWYEPGFSSFFPKPGAGSSWTKENIIRWTEQALTNPKDKDRPTREGWETSPRAIRKTDTGRALERIRVNKVPCKVQYQAGEMASIYPIVPQ